MSDYILNCTSKATVTASRTSFTNPMSIRILLDKISQFQPLIPPKSTIWIDAGIESLDNLASRTDDWLDYLRQFPKYDQIANLDSSLTAADVEAFVNAIMKKCLSVKPKWITVPQLPLTRDSSRNKVNRMLAKAVGKWKSSSSYNGILIFPVIVTHQEQINKKVQRNTKVDLVHKCYSDAHADGLWIVDKSLEDDSGSSLLHSTRYPGIIAFHTELNGKIATSIRVGGPYWGLNLVLWAKGLIDHPMIGVGTGYQFMIAGGQVSSSTSRIAVPCLRRRIKVNADSKRWLDSAISMLSTTHSAYSELDHIRKNWWSYSDLEVSRLQICRFYKAWYDSIHSIPSPGRSLALFQDLATAYSLGKSLPDITQSGTDRRPEAVAQPLMMSCL